MKLMIIRVCRWSIFADGCDADRWIPGYRSVRVLIKEIIHDAISEKSEMEKQRKGYCTMKIYEKIFARLEELHMSQTELSRRTGIATSTISDWRKKQINPQADKLVSICKALDMTLVELLCDEEWSVTLHFLMSASKSTIVPGPRNSSGMFLLYRFFW